MSVEFSLDLKNLRFNPQPSRIMHIDLNSCFATIEQQANSFLRNKPICVAAYVTDNGCVLAPSIEAKKYGVKVGMRVRDAKKLCPAIIVLSPDTAKYRYIHLKLRELLETYTTDVSPKSIDEFVLDFAGFAAVYNSNDLFAIAQDIKAKIKKQIGDYLTVSIGISTNKYLAKTASNLHKPDGLDEIHAANHLEIYNTLSLTNLCGIAEHTAKRLGKYNINTVLDLYNADPKFLHFAFGSVFGYYWYIRLRGWEIENYTCGRRSFSNSYSLPKATNNFTELSPILIKLTEKMCLRARQSGYKIQGVGLALSFASGQYFHMSYKTRSILFDTRDVYKEIVALYQKAPKERVKLAAVSCFNLVVDPNLCQIGLFENQVRKENLVRALDKINTKWGNFVIGMSEFLLSKKNVADRIGFGRVRELDDSEKGMQVW